MRTTLLLLFTLQPLLVSPQSKESANGLQSGPSIGENLPAFDPRHVAGPDKGTKACPMCKYGYQQGVLVWINTDDFANVTAIAKRLEAEIEAKGFRQLRAFVVYMNPDEKKKEELESFLSSFAEDAGLKLVAVAYVPNPTDSKTSGLYTINPSRDVKNTVIVYRNRKTIAKYINLKATEENLTSLINSVEKSDKAN